MQVTMVHTFASGQLYRMLKVLWARRATAEQLECVPGLRDRI